MFTHKNLALGLLLCGSVLSTTVLAEEPTISVYKSPICGCCSQWISHLEASGFKVDPIDTSDLRTIKTRSGIAPEMASCHTAQVGGYVIEGHVPAEDIRRLLAEHPDARGLTVPGMPPGSPGMDTPNPRHYQVLLMGKDGSTEVFAEH